MSAIGALLFCNDCGNLLPASKSSKPAKVKCDVCGTVCEDVSSKITTTTSNPSEYPSELRQKNSNVPRTNEDELEQGAIINTPCDKCGRKEVRFQAVQLRSADEGTTVFYSCQCGNKWTENN